MEEEAIKGITDRNRVRNRIYWMVFNTITFSIIIFISMLFIELLSDKVKIAVKKPIYNI